MHLRESILHISTFLSSFFFFILFFFLWLTQMNDFFAYIYMCVCVCFPVHFVCLLTGVGTRHYYRKLGYELDGPYMAKML